jgi:hypothetical protein
MRFINIDKVMEKRVVSTKAIESILAHTNLKDSSVNYEILCQEKEDFLLEDVTIYDDLVGKNNLYVFKDSDKMQMICFKPKYDRIQIRTIKQILADISTSYLIDQFDDNTFAEFFKHFNIPMNALIEAYAKLYKLRIPEDICFFYKGGNIFRILLRDISRIMESREYISLLKRSDADFQIFINPKLKNYKQIIKDISILVIYCLIIFKKIIFKKNLFEFFRIKESELLPMYKKELEANGIGKIINMELVIPSNRKDFSIEPSDYNGEKIVMYREHDSLLDNVPKLRNQSDFFISRNTALRFARKDNLKSVFDLIRMKRNIKIRFKTDNGKITTLSVPCEIIDVSIPKDDDYGMNSLKDKIDKYIRPYNFVNLKESFMFWAPTVNYMIKDLDDVLFRQNEYPWSDLKIDKRASRYFLSLLFHQIMIALIDKEDLISRLRLFKNELNGLINFLNCYAVKNSCEVEYDNISRLFMTKYLKLSKKINMIKNDKEKVTEIHSFVAFNKKLVIIIKNLTKEIDNLIANMGKVNMDKLSKIHEQLTITHILGGGRPCLSL